MLCTLFPLDIEFKKLRRMKEESQESHKKKDAKKKQLFPSLDYLNSS
jgi:hypothetical protein